MQINKDSFHKAIDPTIDLTEETFASINTVAELAVIVVLGSHIKGQIWVMQSMYYHLSLSFGNQLT